MFLWIDVSFLPPLQFNCCYCLWRNIWIIVLCIWNCEPWCFGMLQWGWGERLSYIKCVERICPCFSFNLCHSNSFLLTRLRICCCASTFKLHIFIIGFLIVWIQKCWDFQFVLIFFLYMKCLMIDINTLLPYLK